MLLLTEHQRSDPVILTQTERAQLKDWFNAKFEPADSGRVIVIPGARVGAARIGEVDVVVQPKLPIHRILTLISEAADPYRWLPLEVDGLSSSSLHDAVASLFARSCNTTFDRGLLQSYRQVDQRLPYVRGKMNIPAYVTTPMPLPIPVRSGVFDADNLENQVLRAALSILRQTPALSPATRDEVQRAWRFVSHVTTLREPLKALSRLNWNRRNQYYKQSLSLARLILTSGSSTVEDSQSDSHTIPGLVINMPTVVEEWVRTQLRDFWALDERSMPSSWAGRLWLDKGRTVELKPDLGVMVDGTWRFVGDIKYKEFAGYGARNDDLYQLVSYLTATGLESGVLIYAGGPGQDVSLEISTNGMNLRAVTVNLSSDSARQELRQKLDFSIVKSTGRSSRATADRS